MPEKHRGIKILPQHQGRYCLTIMEPESNAVKALFEDLGLQGGGYTWEGIVSALLRERLPDRAGDISIGAEADNMYVHSADRALLETIAELVAEVASDPQKIEKLVETDDDDIE